MTQAVKRVLETIDALPLAVRQEVIAELIRRAAHSDHDGPTDGELVGLADQVFLGLDEREPGR